MVSGTTQVVAVIGHPIAQVKSPDNFNRYFAEQHMDSVMIPVDIVPDAVAAYLNALRGWQNMTGVLVTVPHKQRAAALVDDLTQRARRLNAVNVIRKLADGRLQGDMLDGVGFQLAAEAQGFQPAGKQALLSGCGGVGSAIARGLCEAGIRRLALHDQTPATRQRLHDLLAEAFPAVQLSALPDTLYGLDLLVNGSPAGMAGFDELPLPQALLDYARQRHPRGRRCHRPGDDAVAHFRRRPWLQSTDRAGNGAGADEADGPVYRRHPAGTGAAA